MRRAGSRRPYRRTGLDGLSRSARRRLVRYGCGLAARGGAQPAGANSARCRRGAAARRLGEGLDIRLNTPVTCVRWNGPGGRVAVETAQGAVTAGAAIVTVSTGVLASGAIAFDPVLPADVQASIAALPMGLAMKVAL